MSKDLITERPAFLDLCDHIRESGIVAFDTEFVSDSRYRPDLGLLQFATRDRCAAVDPLAVTDLGEWWDVMSDDETTVVVHGGQAEIRFCLDLGGERPRRLVDLQLAEGLRSRSYPLAYSSLAKRVIGHNVDGKQTRTDWHRRPLSDQQIRYALDDVAFILPIWDQQRDDLEQQGRLDWAEAEFVRIVDDIVSDSEAEPWRRLPSVHRLSRRELAVARELAAWREQEAVSRNRHPRRVLRDDLVIDLSRRQPTTMKQLQTNRDMNRSDYRRISDQILAAVKRGRDIDPGQVPRPPRSPRNDKNPDEEVLGKLLALALANRCADMNIAMPLVATSSDLVRLVRIHVYNDRDEERPRLMDGWRAEVCGDLLLDVLDGRISIRVADARSETPLEFERR